MIQSTLVKLEHLKSYEDYVIIRELDYNLINYTID